MMGDHSNEETEYPTNSTSAVDGRDDTPVPSTLPPSSTEEEDLWQGYLMILIFLIFLGGAYFAILSYERRWLFEYENSRHIFGKREKARRKEQLEKELKVKRWGSCDLEEGEMAHHATVESDDDFSSSSSISMKIDMRTVLEQQKPGVILLEDDSNNNVLEDDHDQPECAICLEHFRDSQLVCEPTNVKCNHSFHKECMTVWLMRHTRCPICREKYLEKNHLEVEPNV